MKHPGHCYRNSNVLAAIAEESQSVVAARSLLLDNDGNYLGDDTDIFGKTLISDNDTRGPKAFIREQIKIIGVSANNLAEQIPNKGHVIKCHNNALFKLQDEDKTFSGAHGLTNLRIKSINSDIKNVINDYKDNGIGNPKNKKDCIDQLQAIVPHQCGNHSQCKFEKWCSYIEVRNKNPSWDSIKIAEEAARKSKRAHSGKNMSLSSYGFCILTSKIIERFNDKLINKIAEGGCSNMSEIFWMMTTNFFQGKHLNLDLADGW